MVTFWSFWATSVYFSHFLIALGAQISAKRAKARCVSASACDSGSCCFLHSTILRWSSWIDDRGGTVANRLRIIAVQFILHTQCWRVHLLLLTKGLGTTSLQAIFGIVKATHIRHALKDGIDVLAARTATFIGCPRATFSQRSGIDSRVIGVGPKFTRLRWRCQPTSGILDPFPWGGEFLRTCEFSRTRGIAFCSCSRCWSIVTLSKIASEKEELVTRDFTEGHACRLMLSSLPVLSRGIELTSLVPYFSEV